MSRWSSILHATVGALALLALGSVVPARAQAPPDPLASAVAAFTDLEFDVAATRLRTALGLSGTQRLSDEHRTRALMYLGATEIYREQRPAAVEAFRSCMQQSGELEAKRKLQASDWMWTLLMDDLKEMFLRDRQVEGLLDQVQAAVANGLTTPSAASRRLLEAFKRT